MCNGVGKDDVELHEFDKPKPYIDYLTVTADHWWHNHQNNWIFRGQSYPDLLPSLYRNINNTVFYRKEFEVIEQDLFESIYGNGNDYTAGTLVRITKNFVDGATYRVSLDDNQKDRLIDIAKSLLVEIY